MKRELFTGLTSRELIPIQDMNSTAISPVAPFKNSTIDLATVRYENSSTFYEDEIDWVSSLLGLRSGGEDALAKYKLNATEMKKYRKLMRKYCKDDGEGKDEDFIKMMKAAAQCIRCLRKLVDPKRVKVEIEMAHPFGHKGMKRIFGKYCEKKFLIKECIYSLTFKTVPICMSKEAKNYTIAYNAIIDWTLNFWCYDAGDRIALFYANDGANCFATHFETMDKCSEDFGGTVFWKNCGAFPEFLKCVVKAMKQCRSPHPMRIIKALLTVIYRRSTCYGGRGKPWVTRPPPTEDYNY